MPAAPEYTVQRFRGGFAIVWWEPAGRKRQRLDATDRKSAEAEARRKWERSESGDWTVGRFMTGYLASIAHKPSHSRRIDAWKALSPFWANIAPSLIDERMARDYHARRRAGPATVRYELMQISTALGWAMGQGHITTRRPIWLPPTPERKQRHLTYADFQRLFDAARADHARLYMQIGIWTMARPSAILDLTWDRVDFMRGLIDFTPAGHVRTAKRRTVVPIAAQLVPHLQQGHAARTCEFVIERGGDRIACIKKAFQAASQRSSVHATPYTLRHTGAVWAAEAGVPMAELAQFMGHDDDRTTQKHYARLGPDYLRGVTDRMEIAMGGSK